MVPGFREIVLADFEFEIGQGERPVPVCLVAHELYSGRKFRIFQDQFGAAPPYVTGPDVLFVAYYASAELGCYRVLSWPIRSGSSICSRNSAIVPMDCRRYLSSVY